MYTRFARWYRANHAMLTNAVALVGTTGVNAVLGLVYWWVGAQYFPAAEVGIASASISAMMLLGTGAMLGMGTLLISQLATADGKRGDLVASALLVAASSGLLLGVGFAVLAPWLSSELRVLGSGMGTVLLFGLGVSLTAVVLVLDQILIGVLWGGVQFSRNLLFAGSKLLVLALLPWVASSGSGLAIYATWLVGNYLSLMLVGWVAARRTGRLAGWPRWPTLKGLLRGGLAHHTLNLALQTPGLALPVLVAVVLSAEAAGRFYIAWMLASYVFVIPFALAMVLFAVGSADRAVLAEKLRLSVGLSCGIGLAAWASLALLAGPLLGLFGAGYASEATGVLQLLGLAVVAIAIKDHYVAIHRVEGRVTAATLPVLLGAVVELAAPAVGGMLGGLTGVALGWLVGLYLQTLWMAPLVWRTARLPRPVVPLPGPLTHDV
ncbi:MAG: hypothetical protein MUD01_00980 [Chloroflexaceae bacterium]|nr:hypothetical protein [Chloroflexaceae bacterium]